MAATLATERSTAPSFDALWLTAAERNPPSLGLADSVFAAVDAFQANPELRLIPVLDDARRPIGAIFEADIRRLLLNPFGHALLRNPAFGHGIARRLRHDAGVLSTQMDAFLEAIGHR